MARNVSELQVDDVRRGLINVKIIDRINPDDVLLHLIERELFTLNGGSDPGTELNRDFTDFLVRERFIQEV